MHAACMSLLSAQQDVVSDLCEQYVLGPCAPGAEGDRACRGQENAHRTSCAPAPGEAGGFRCDCTPGWSDVSGTCVNVNECRAFSLDLCDRSANNGANRNACRDTPGGYVCEYGLPDECSRNFGGCWSEQRSDGGIVTSCQDNFQAYSDAVALVRARAQPPRRNAHASFSRPPRAVVPVPTCAHTCACIRGMHTHAVRPCRRTSCPCTCVCCFAPCLHHLASHLAPCAWYSRPLCASCPCWLPKSAAPLHS